MKQNKTCAFFLKGHCIKGNDCKFEHPGQNTGVQMNMQYENTPRHQQSNPNKSICSYFLKGSCTKANCSFLHGFSENLEHITLDEIHSMPIISACNITDRKYVTADEHILNIWEIAETKKLIINQKFEEKISKVIFSGEKLIIAASIEQILSSKSKIYVVTDNNMYSQEGDLKKINDLIEIDSFILTVGDNLIESFIYGNNQLVKGKSVNNDLSNSEIICISFHVSSKLFFCGHKGGNISAWTPTETTFLSCQEITKIHDGAINKILIYKDNFLITCSSDNTIKVFDLLNQFNNIVTMPFESSVLDIFIIHDIDEKENFALNLGNGNINVTDTNFQTLFNIPSVKGSIKRFVLNLTNPVKSDKEGNFLIITDGNSMSVNLWCKPSYMKQNQQSHQTHQYQQHHTQQYQKPQSYQDGFGRGYNERGGYRGKQNFKRGGY